SRRHIFSLIIEVRLHLVTASALGHRRAQWVFIALKLSTETSVQLWFRTIINVRDSTCDAQPLGRFWTIIVVPAVEMRVKTNCFNLRLSESYLFGCGLSTASDNPNPGNSVRVHDCPFHGAPTAHRDASQGVESMDSQQVSMLSCGMRGGPRSHKRQARSLGSPVFIQ